MASLGDGRQTVATAGTRVQLSAQGGLGRVCSVAITALSTNTGVIVVGGNTCVAAAGTRRGVALNANDSVSFDTDDLSDIYIDATVNGEGVSYAYILAA